MLGDLELFALLPPHSGPIRTLRAGEWDFGFSPECGARITHLKHRKRDVLRPASPEALSTGNVYGFSGFPLIPYSGPVFGGGFTYRDEFFPLERNVRDEPTATHGEGWIRPWLIEELNEQRCSLTFAHDARPGTFPFRYRACLTYELCRDSLEVAITLRNLDHRSMPAGIGFHPYFKKQPGTQIKFSSLGVWPPDAPEHVNRGCAALTEGLDFSDGQDAWPLVIDRCFEGWDGEATVSQPDGMEIRLTASDALRRLQVYDPWDYPYICVEPVSNANDGFNRHAHKVSSHGVVDLEPGMVLSGRISVSVSQEL